jgi:hypothetical protein
VTVLPGDVLIYGVSLPDRATARWPAKIELMNFQIAMARSPWFKISRYFARYSREAGKDSPRWRL